MFGTSKILSIVNASGCNIKAPGHVPLDVDNYPVAPDNLALEQVHVYVRHGTCWLVVLLFALEHRSITPQANAHP
jgi:hypothetical protein